MTYLLDTDHFSVLQRRSSAEYAQLRLRMSRYSLSDFGVSIVSFHEQALGCHEYIKRARVRQNLLRGYEMLARVLTDYRSLTVLHFSAAEAATFDQLRSAGAASVRWTCESESPHCAAV